MRTFVFLTIFVTSYASCPFCDPKVLEAQTFLVEEGVLGLCTNHPVVPGHVLIIPQRHVERFEELTDGELQGIGRVIQKIHKAAIQLFGQDDYLLIQKNGKTAGQSVPHVHFHYYPRSQEIGTLGFVARFLAAPHFPAQSEEKMKNEILLWREQLERNP